MTTRTELANRALAHLGEAPIADIDDTTVEAARLCKEFTGDVIDEVLRCHRWNCAIDRATLSRLDTAPDHGFDYAYQLPSGCLRLLEVNGEQFDGSDEYFEIEAGQRVITDADAVEIRYVKRIDVPEFDALLAKAVSLALAVEIAVPITKNDKLRETLEAAYLRALGRASKVDAIEVGSREVRPLMRLLENSPLRNSRYGRWHRDRPLTVTTPAEEDSSTGPDLDGLFEAEL